MTPTAEVLDNLVAVLVVAGVLALLLVIHFIVAMDDLRRQIRELRSQIRGFPGRRS